MLGQVVQSIAEAGERVKNQQSSLIERKWRSAIRKLDYGELEFVAPNGEVTTVTGARPGPRANFRIADWNVLRRILARGDIGLGEEYIAGSWQTPNIEE